MTVVTRIDFCKLSVACYRAYLEIVRAIEAALSCLVGWAMHSLVRVATQSLNRASRLRHRVTHTYVRAEIGVQASRQSIRRPNPNIQLHLTAIRNQSHNCMKLLLVLGFERGYESATVGPTDLQRVAALGIDQHGGVREQQELPCRTSRTDPGQWAYSWPGHDRGKDYHGQNCDLHTGELS